MKLLALIAVLVLLCGCTPRVYKGSGRPAPIPGGFEQLCHDMPEFPSCPPSTK